ncbi:MAG: hypothetical protein ACRD27_04985 [Terracidiphilus sp.]
MRKLLTRIAFALLFVAGAAASDAAQKPPTPPSPTSAQATAAQNSPTQSAPPEQTQATATMQTFTSNDGRFSVLLPGSPTQKALSFPLPSGAASNIYEFWVVLDNDNVTYIVMYNDYPPNYANDGAQNVLARTRDGAAKGKTLTSDVAIDLNGVPGRAFTVTGKDGSLYSVHQFLNGKRLYQLIVVYNKDHPATLTDQFMNSFRIF